MRTEKTKNISKPIVEVIMMITERTMQKTATINGGCFVNPNMDWILYK